MPTSHDVRLARDVVARFPDRCVRCGAPEPGHTWRHAGRSLGLSWLFPLALGRRVAVDVPACHACEERLAAQRFRRRVVDTALVVAGVAVAFALVDDDATPWRKALGFALALAFVLPALVHHALRPAPYDLTVGSDHVDHEFADPQYARDFAELNRG
jgi:hypothetical protein